MWRSKVVAPPVFLPRKVATRLRIISNKQTTMGKTAGEMYSYMIYSCLDKQIAFYLHMCIYDITCTPII